MKSFIRKDAASYFILNKKSNIFKNDELFEVLNNYIYQKNSKFLYYLKKQGKAGLFLEAVYLIDKSFFDFFEV